jgi:hypothetical protein
MESTIRDAAFTSNQAAYHRRQSFARPLTLANGKRYPQGYRYYLDPPNPNLAPSDIFFLLTAVEFWLTRYIPRMQALDPERAGLSPLADKVARDLLVARMQSRNRLCSALPGVPAEQIPLAESLLAQSGLDIATLLDVPSYGPSFISLWADAKTQGLSDADALAHIWRWAKAWPVAWERDDERKQKGLPSIDPQLKPRLEQVVRWREVDDLDVPWQATAGASHWQVRLNDFPDDHMYTLLVEGRESGDFDDWPEVWDRGEPELPRAQRNVAVLVRPLPEISPATLLNRYQNGEHEAVWRDLVALGGDVRQPPYLEPARAVAHETMRRARVNVELLLSRLEELGYEFFGAEPNPFRPATGEEKQCLVQAEDTGPSIPLSVQAWVNEVGWVDFVGSHPVLAFMDDDDGHPGIYTDPLEATFWNLVDVCRAWRALHPDERKQIRLQTGADAKSKGRLAAGWEVSGSYSLLLPNTAADAVLDGADDGITFVEYLRLSFQWGGFPGWRAYEKRPEKEIAFLKRDLLPI